MSEMSNEKKEMVMDIVAEKLRETQDILRIIEAAYGRHEVELRDLKRENTRLLAALKPVLEVALSYEDGEPIGLDDGEVCTDSEYAVSVNGRPIDDHTLAGCLAAVREARRVYDESRKSEIKE